MVRVQRKRNFPKASDGVLKNARHRCLIFEVQGKKNIPATQYGGVAQLGEHLLCKQGVIGSIPFISTNTGS